MCVCGEGGGGNGVVMCSCVCVCLLSFFFSCALWCSIQVIVHVTWTNNYNSYTFGPHNQML